MKQRAGEKERWPASSGQISALDKWNLCHLPLRRSCRDLRQAVEVGEIRRHWPQVGVTPEEVRGVGLERQVAELVDNQQPRLGEVG
jgi:hypothetical protein